MALAACLCESVTSSKGVPLIREAVRRCRSTLFIKASCMASSPEIRAIMRSSILERSALTYLLPAAGRNSLLIAGASSPLRGICWALGWRELILPVEEGIWKY